MLAGDSRLAAQVLVKHSVSIHARHCWRATRCYPSQLYRQDAVSIHARHCWRATPLFPRLADQAVKVSIHARHCWRATRTDSGKASSVITFQSTPAIAGGRLNRFDSAKTFINMFQSTPAIAGGRLVTGHYHPQPHLSVSIHARHCWRATRVVAVMVARPVAVSIHARHCWRATLGEPGHIDLV